MKVFLTVIILVYGSVLHARAQGNRASGNPDSLIVAALNMVNQDSLHSYVQSLQDMGTRFMIAPNRKEVATWIMNKFLSFGITDVRLDSFPAYVSINMFALNYDTTTWQYNVEARIPGTEFPGKEMIMMGHYDNATIHTDPIFAAPGADDNASGTAALLESARIISQMDYNPKQTIIFLAMAAEELMGFGDSGAEHYAAEALAAGRDIVMAVNNDMIGWNSGTWTIKLLNHSGSPEITALALDIITNYTTLNYQSSTPVPNLGGDIQPFLEAGYHGIYFMEHLINPNYHTLGDSIDYLDFNYMAEATGIGLGCVLQTDLTVNTLNHPTQLSTLKIMPNPASDYIIVSTPGINITQNLMIYSLDGTLSLSTTINTSTTLIDISSLLPGVYIVVAAYGEVREYSRLVVI